jgi:hypothetical protein
MQRTFLQICRKCLKESVLTPNLSSKVKHTFKYVEKSLNNMPLPQNTSKGEICFQICENGLNNVFLPLKFPLNVKAFLQICEI